MLRIAWMGPLPMETSGVPYVATQIIRGLAAAGAEIDAFVAGDPDELAASLKSRSDVRVFLTQPGWNWDHWLGRFEMSGYMADQASRAVALSHALERVLSLHREQPYDVLYQFSRPEPIPSQKALRELPPLVLHPQVHAAGELRAMWFDRRLLQTSETVPRIAAAASAFGLRAVRQRARMPKAALVLAPSRRFARYLVQDCGVADERIALVPNPVDGNRFVPARRATAALPVELLFVSYLAVRKGIDMIIDLSHRLADLAGKVRIVVIGGPRPWCDLTKLLADADARVVEVAGLLDGPALQDRLRGGGALLAPSSYEPFGLSVLEALSSGVPVIASDEVGATEWVHGPAVTQFPTGDGEAFEAAVRAFLDRVVDRDAVASQAREQIAKLDEETVGRGILETFRDRL